MFAWVQRSLRTVRSMSLPVSILQYRWYKTHCFSPMVLPREKHEAGAREKQQQQWHQPRLLSHAGSVTTSGLAILAAAFCEPALIPEKAAPSSQILPLPHGTSASSDTGMLTLGTAAGPPVHQQKGLFILGTLCPFRGCRSLLRGRRLEDDVFVEYNK